MFRRLIFGLLVSCLLATGCAASPSIALTETASPADGVLAAASPEPVIALVSTVSRDQAIAQLIEVAFLTYSDSSCVVDALHAEIGIYDFNHPAAMEQTNQADLMAGCTAEDVPAEAKPPADAEPSADSEAMADVAQDEETMDEEALDEEAMDDEPAMADEAMEDEPAMADEAMEDEAMEDEPAVAFATDESSAAQEAVPAQSPAFTPGGMKAGWVEIAGVGIDYVAVTPAGFSPGASAPVLIALPDDDFSLADNADFVDVTFVDTAVSLGWVVVSPSLDGRPWTDERNAALIFELTEWIGTWVAIEGGRPHLGGIGTGGSGAFAIATQNPSAIESLAVYPGMPPTPLDAAVPQLAQVPVRMWVIDNDGNPWIAALTAAQLAIRDAGGDAKLDVLALEEVLSFANGNALGRIIFNELQALR